MKVHCFVWVVDIDVVIILLVGLFVGCLCDLPGYEEQVCHDLYTSFNSPKLTNWGTNVTCCEWNGITCDQQNTHIIGFLLQGLNLIGTIPESIGNLTSLQVFDISLNQLTGTLTGTSLGNLGVLQWLDLSYNQLSGTIPNILSTLTSITMIHLGSNLLSGSIFPLSDLTKLQHLDLSEDKLNGMIPSFGNLTQLQVFDLNTNQLSGTIPESLGFSSHLNIFDLSKNALTTPLPNFLRNPFPHSINLNFNSFCCPIYQWIIDKGVGTCVNCGMVPNDRQTFG